MSTYTEESAEFARASRPDRRPGGPVHPAQRLERAALVVTAEILALEIRGRPLARTPVLDGVRRFRHGAHDLGDQLWSRVLAAPPGTRELD